MEALLKVIYEGADYEDPSHLKLIYASFKQNEENRMESENQVELDQDNFEGGLEQLDRILEMKRDFQWIPVPKAFHQRK